MPKMCRGFNFLQKIGGIFRDIVQCIHRDITSLENRFFIMAGKSQIESNLNMALMPYVIKFI